MHLLTVISATLSIRCRVSCVEQFTQCKQAQIEHRLMLHAGLLMRNASAPSHNSPLFTKTNHLFISCHGQRGHGLDSARKAVLGAIWSQRMNSRQMRISERWIERQKKDRKREGGKRNVGHHNHIRNQFSAQSEKGGLALC